MSTISDCRLEPEPGRNEDDTLSITRMRGHPLASQTLMGIQRSPPSVVVQSLFPYPTQWPTVEDTKPR